MMRPELRAKSCTDRAHVPQLLKPGHPETVLRSQKSRRGEAPAWRLESSPRTATRGKPTRSEDPAQPKGDVCFPRFDSDIMGPPGAPHNVVLWAGKVVHHGAGDRDVHSSLSALSKLLAHEKTRHTDTQSQRRELATASHDAKWCWARTEIPASPRKLTKLQILLPLCKSLADPVGPVPKLGGSSRPSDSPQSVGHFDLT
ncbi:hypothetical protein MJG53_012228 [Ovis ammon polii x Ovis aries]|uniref:Uncharacterized protein n=1 Tax=Ovis ammon polii x Ovis aries TaxID=2918886 RepID=A0ACB9UMV6_9CETA|nr:hypothetical protein MJG53_012228 [Ovis ammon polii x Ovis aries]